MLAGAVHRVAGVDGEVEDRIFELGRVGPDVPGLGGEAGVDGDPLADRAVDQLEHVLDQLGRRDRVGQQGLGAGEGEQAAGQRGGAGRALHRIVEVELDLAARAVQLAPGEIEAADDDREHVVEIVGDAAGQLADRLHLLDLAELRLGGGALGRLLLQRAHWRRTARGCAPAPPARGRARASACASASRRAATPLGERAPGEQGEARARRGRSARRASRASRYSWSARVTRPWVVGHARVEIGALGGGDLLELARAAPAGSARRRPGRAG